MLMKTPRHATGEITLDAHPVAKTDFDRLVVDFDGVVQEMTVAFAESRWPGVTLDPWIYFLDGKPVAAVLVMLKAAPLNFVTIAIVKWGPILADHAAPDLPGIHNATLSHLMDEYATRRGMMVSILPRAEPEPLAHAPENLWARGFVAGNTITYPDRYYVKVPLGDAEQRKSFAQKWRYHLNKAEKEGLVFEAAPASDLPRFQKLYAAMSERKRFPDYSAYQTLPHLFAKYPEALKPRLFFVSKNGEDVAGAVIFTAGQTAIYLYGATSDMALPLRAGYLMHARIISWLRDHSRAEWYDLGGNDGFSGLHQFKKGMVGSAGAITSVPPIGHFAATRRIWIAGLLIHELRDLQFHLQTLAARLRGTESRPDLKPGTTIG